tara:strand:- start:441 stop:1100 length:660 start_codon:yes stop_codon:yes gene_type:complete
MYNRNCPDCDKVLQYKYKHSLKIAIEKNRYCTTCCRIGERHNQWTGSHQHFCPDCKVEIKHKLLNNQRRAVRLNSKCKSCSAKDKISKLGVHKNFVNSKRNLGMKHTEETKKKMSTSAIKRGANLHSVNYNKSSIPIIEKFGKDNGYNFQHAENGGEYKVRIESGREYWIDGYDKEKNVVVEYIENSSWHNSPKKKIYHELRKKEICRELGCSYYEIYE